MALQNKKNYDKVFEEFKNLEKDINDFYRVLGKGAFGEVRDVRINGKLYAAKLVEKERRDNIEPDILKNKNIITIIRVLEKNIFDKFYDLIIMEKAVLKDVGTLFPFLSIKNLLKLINNPFLDIISDNLLRYFTLQIINGLETLERYDLVHFDIKPENLLITSGLILKISDFSFLKNLKHASEQIKIPGGTLGFVSPEFYRKEKINKEIAKKQDYFALGCTIYFLKFGHKLLNYRKYESNKISEIRVIELLSKNINKLKSNLLLDIDFINFICGLVGYSPDERFSFEDIYRNKWLNKSNKDIHYIKYNFCEGEEYKQLIELAKSDFVMDKKKELNKRRRKFIFNRHNKNRIV